MIMNKQEAEMYIELIKRQDIEVKKAQALADALRRELKDYMVSNGITVIDAGLLQAKCSEIKKPVLDQKALKADMPELCEKYTKISVEHRLTVK